MNQRIRRSQMRKSSGISINTGGHIVNYTPEKEIVVRVPPKVTGDIQDQPKGLAKASPNFKQIEPIKPKNKKDEKKVIAESTEQIVSEDTKEQNDIKL